jgi:hypothetical protein
MPKYLKIILIIISCFVLLLFLIFSSFYYIFGGKEFVAKNFPTRYYTKSEVILNSTVKAECAKKNQYYERLICKSSTYLSQSFIVEKVTFPEFATEYIRSYYNGWDSAPEIIEFTYGGKSYRGNPKNLQKNGGFYYLSSGDLFIDIAQKKVKDFDINTKVNFENDSKSSLVYKELLDKINQKDIIFNKIKQEANNLLPTEKCLQVPVNGSSTSFEEDRNCYRSNIENKNKQTQYIFSKTGNSNFNKSYELQKLQSLRLRVSSKSDNGNFYFRGINELPYLPKLEVGEGQNFLVVEVVCDSNLDKCNISKYFIDKGFSSNKYPDFR